MVAGGWACGCGSGGVGVGVCFDFVYVCVCFNSSICTCVCVLIVSLHVCVFQVLTSRYMLGEGVGVGETVGVGGVLLAVSPQGVWLSEVNTQTCCVHKPILKGGCTCVRIDVCVCVCFWVC